MRNGISLPWTALAALALATTASFAQSPPADRESADNARRAAETARQTAREADAQKRRDANERGGVEQELDRARDEMEQAAAEVARLSAEYMGPLVDDMSRRFRYAGQRAMLGLNIADTAQGARVNGVSPNGPAAEAGLEVGDVIVSVDGASLVGDGDARQSPSELLLAQMRNVDAGKQVKLGILRDGKSQDVTVTTRELGSGRFFGAARGNCPPGSDDDESCARSSFPGPDTWQRFFAGYNPWRQMQLVTLTPQLGAYFGTDAGLLVVRGPTDTTLGLRDGDVILEIGGRAPSSPEHALRILASFEAGESLKVTIMRKQRRETLDLTMPTEAPGRG